MDICTNTDSLGIGVLVSDDIPELESIDNLLKSLDEQLGDANRQIELCIKSVYQKSNELLGASSMKHFHPADVLNHIDNSGVLQKTHSYDSNTQEVIHVLNTLYEKLNTKNGSEDYVLQKILWLSSEEGLNLPRQTSGGVNRSVLSINTTVSDTDNKLEELWDSLCVKLRRFYIQNLQNLVYAETKMNFEKRLTTLQSLCALYPTCEIWGKYKEIRVQQLGRFLLSQAKVNIPGGENIDPTKAYNKFEKLVCVSKAMMQEDFNLVNSGVFENLKPMDALTEIYLDIFVDELEVIIESVHNNLSLKASNLQCMQNSSHAPSKSTDNLLHGDNFTDLNNVPADLVNVTLRFVTILTNIDNFVQHLNNLTSWKMNSGTLQKTHRKRLRSALKGGRDIVGHSNSRTAFADEDDNQSNSSMTMALEKQQSEKKLWEWRPIYSKIASDIAKSIEEKIAAISEQAFECDKLSLKQGQIFAMVSLNKEIAGGRLDYPTKVSKGIHSLIMETDNVLIVAEAFLEPGLSCITSAYVNCVRRIIENFRANTDLVLVDIGRKYNFKLYYQCLANATFLRNQVFYYENMLSANENEKKSLHTLYKQCCEQVEEIIKLVIDYHSRVLLTTVSQEADSNYYSDDKDFFEDERLSFGVEMWYMHMCALKHDLWETCSPRTSQSILGKILKDSLSIFESRYSTVKPSYNRVNQLRRDLNAILHFASELMYCCCNDLNMFLDAHEGNVLSIHHSCSALLNQMAILTAPLMNVYKVYKKGLKHPHSAEGRMYTGHWLHWLFPMFLPKRKLDVHQLQTTTSVYLQLRLLESQPVINWHVLIQALVMKDFTLSVLLASKVSDSEDNLLMDLVTVSMAISSSSNSVSNVLMPVLEKSEFWKLFEPNTFIGNTQQIPHWVEVIKSILEPYTKRCVRVGIEMLVKQVSTDDMPPGSAQKKLERQVVTETIYTIITQIVNDVFMLPSQALVLFSAIQTELDKRSIHTNHGCAAIKIIATSVIHLLQDRKLLELWLGGAVFEKLSGKCALVAECMYAVLTVDNADTCEGIPDIASYFLTQNSNWLDEQIEILTEYFSNQIYDVNDVPDSIETNPAFIEQIGPIILSRLQNKPKGFESLQRCYNLVMNNYNWLLSQLDITSSKTTSATEFVASAENLEPVSFNPFKTIKDFCVKNNNEELVNWDWTELLHDVSLSEIQLKQVLQQRHEFQANAQLNEQEAKYVNTFKNRMSML